MSLVILITLSVHVLLSFIMPFSRSVKWIENASTSYYFAYSWIEDALYFLKTRWDVINSDTWSIMPNTSTWFAFQTYSTWNIIPKAWKWNSEYDNKFNTISQINPLQLAVWNWYISDFTNVNFTFRVPDMNWDSVEDDEALSWGTLPIINWMLSSENDTLIASWSYIKANDIKKANCSWTCDWKINSQSWVVLDWTSNNFQTYYNSNCWTNSWCVLKISVINDLKLTSLKKIPYLEYKIDWLWNSFPDRYTTVESYGKSHWFQKKLEVSIPQQTVNQALDFTVFQ